IANVRLESLEGTLRHASKLRIRGRDGSSPSRLPESQSAGVSLPEVSLIDPASMTAESSGLSGSASLCFALLQFCDLGVRVLIDSSTLAEFSRLRECRDGIIDLVFSRVRLA